MKSSFPICIGFYQIGRRLQRSRVKIPHGPATVMRVQCALSRIAVSAVEQFTMDGLGHAQACAWVTPFLVRKGVF